MGYLDAKKVCNQWIKTAFHVLLFSDSKDMITKYGESLM